MELKKYKHEAPYSYTLGMAPTLELIQCRPASVDKIYIHPNYTPKDDAYNIFEVCKRTHLPYEVNKKVFDRLSGKENVFVLGSFFKYDAPILPDLPHVVLVNPSNAGNLGTIIRTGLGFGFKDLVIIRPGVDPYDPKPFAPLWEPYSISVFLFWTLLKNTASSFRIIKFTHSCSKVNAC